MGSATTDRPATADGMTDEERVELDELQERAKGKRKGLEDEAGPAVGDMPPKDPEPGPEPELEKILVKGSDGKVFDVGGKLPQSAVLKLNGATLEILPGEGFEKGATVHFSGIARVVSVGSKDRLDKRTLTAVEAVQEHSAKILDFVVDKIVEP